MFRFRSSSHSLSVVAVVAVLFVSIMLGCTSLRGRADDAFKRGDYRQAVELYAQLLARNPNDAAVKAQLTRAERALLDQVLDRAEAKRNQGNQAEAFAAVLDAMQTKDRVHSEALDGPRPERLVAIVDWAKGSIRTSVKNETTRGRALAAHARRVSYAPLLVRPELTALGPELDVEIKAAGARTCARGTATAAEQPFTLELVAAYCKEVGAPLPAWKPRPLLVGGITLEGTISGTPVNERPEVERVVTDAMEHSVWFTSTSSLRATARLQGTVSSIFTNEQTELSRSWTESVPYEATESYTEEVQVPYTETETYTESVPYTAFEDRLEPCPPPATGQCNRSHRVTRYREESRQRTVQRYRTEHHERTRQVTRYRDEPRIFRFPATKHEGRYQASFSVRVDPGSAGLRPIDARNAAEDARTAYEHDTEFAPAGVHPEHGRSSLTSAVSWRQQQRDRLGADLLHALDAGWTQAFCSESVASIEEAARCLHGRPRPMPRAVRAQIEALFGDDPDRVLALPRPGESVH